MKLAALLGASRPAAPAKPVYLFELHGIGDRFLTAEDAAPLWTGTDFFSGGSDGIRDPTGNPNRRMKAMAEAAARPAGGRTLVPRCWVLAAHSERLRVDRQTGWEGSYGLIEELERLYRDEFQGRIDEEHRGVRIVIAEHDDDPDILYMTTGRTVDIAAPGERPVATLRLGWTDEDGRRIEVPAPAWPILRRTESGAIVREMVPAALYEGQRWLHVGASLGLGGMVAAGMAGEAMKAWFFIDVYSEDNYAAGSGDGSELEAAGSLTVDRASGQRTWTFQGAAPPQRPGGQRTRLVCTLDPVDRGAATGIPARHSTTGHPARNSTTGQPARQPAAPAVAAAAEPRPAAQAAAEPAGRSPGARFEVELALPRIDGPRAHPGLTHWQIALDSSGAIIADLNGAALRLGARDQDNALYGATGRGGFDQPLTARGELPLGGGRNVLLHEAPGRLKATHHGFLTLPRTPSLALPCSRTLDRPRGPFVIGRGQLEDEPFLPLGLLSVAGTLTIAGLPGATMERLNFSRGHLLADLLPGDDRLAVTMHEGRFPACLLDPERRIVATLLPGTRATAVLDAGNSLLVGCYLLRFQPASPF